MLAYLKSMSDKNDAEELSKIENTVDLKEIDKKSENILLKGWNSFVNGIRDGFNKFQNVFEEQSKKNQELWNANKDKINNFFTNTKKDLEKSMNDWTLEIKKIQTKNKEIWDKNKEQITSFLNRYNTSIYWFDWRLL